MHLPPFEKLIEAHATDLHRFLVASVGSGEAEDCLQETFMSALRAYPRLRHAENLRAWLFTIAHRKATDTARRRHRHPARPLDGAEPADEAATAAGSVPAPGLPDDGLWLSVRSLPPKQRAAVVHRFVFDLPYTEIAARMGTSEDAARQSVHAGLARLRRELDR